MKKMLNSSDKIMMALALLGDVAIEVYARGNGFGWKKSIFESMNIKNSTFRSTMSRNLKVGNIEKVISKSGEPFYKLTSSGKKGLERFFPLLKLSEKPWDGKWRVLVFDIPEEEKKTREFLRYNLISLGFGKMQDSVYVSPLDVLLDIRELLTSNNLLGKALVFEAKEIFSSDPKSVANYIWKIDEINEKYQELLDQKKEGKLKPSELKEKLFALLKIDPFLPKEFLPAYWVGDEAKKIIISL